MAKVNMDDALVRWSLRRTPIDADALDDARSKGGGLGGAETTNLQHLRLAVRYVIGDAEAQVRDALAAFYARAEVAHRSGSEGVSPGYSSHQVVAALAVRERAAELNDGPLHRAAHAFLRRELTLLALHVADDRPRVVMPGGRVGKHLRPLVGADVQAKGEYPAPNDHAAAVVLGIPWHRQPGWTARWEREVFGDLKALQEQALLGLFTASERVALREGWAFGGVVSSALRGLLAPIRLPERLHQLRGAGGFVAWMAAVESDGATPCQPWVATGGGVDQFVVVNPAGGAARIGPNAWQVVGRGGYKFTATVASDITRATEIVIDEHGGRVVGEPPAPPPPEPPAPPSADPVQAVRARLGEHRAAWDRQRQGTGKARRTEETLAALERAVAKL